ncbi:hypothetical protein [Mycolicibacterium canariasense]|uniref:hypothetical protein n=1 Tax=Mycolicibacterium canariasense TaxID=228230 RepID=UPI000A168F1B|nr:hypothetical protein [Mycolicibacterium canariasense]MCV7208353.1 hypothetical protein [Mycolicibacterium canariasense]ORV13541.1 hypothetical protein AWB94_04785 [Mycolicibacterium canariasense]
MDVYVVVFDESKARPLAHPDEVRARVVGVRNRLQAAEMLRTDEAERWARTSGVRHFPTANHVSLHRRAYEAMTVTNCEMPDDE